MLHSLGCGFAGFGYPDVIEFGMNYVAKAENGSGHPFFGHYHLNFDVGKNDFLKAVNETFARNGFVYELTLNGDLFGSQIRSFRMY